MALGSTQPLTEMSTRSISYTFRTYTNNYAGDLGCFIFLFVYILIRYFIVCTIMPFVVLQVKFYSSFFVQYMLVLYVSLCAILGWILNRFSFGRRVGLTTLPSLSWNLGLTSWNPLGHSMTVTVLLYLYIVVPSVHYFASRISKPLPRIHNIKTKTRVVRNFGQKNKACYGSAREPFDTQIISETG